MDDSPPLRTASGDESDSGTPPKAPRWAKVFGLAAIAALIVAVILMHTLGGGMGSH